PEEPDQVVSDGVGPDVLRRGTPIEPEAAGGPPGMDDGDAGHRAPELRRGQLSVNPGQEVAVAVVEHEVRQEVDDQREQAEGEAERGSAGRRGDPAGGEPQADQGLDDGSLRDEEGQEDQADSARRPGDAEAL